MPIDELRNLLILKLQENTQYYGRRPFGVGLLIIGYDDLGPHVISADPSGNVTEMHAASIGARSQSARTYLEKHLDEFKEAGSDAVIEHALRAVKESLQTDSGKMDEINTAVAIVGKNQPFMYLSKEAIAAHLNAIRADEPPPPPQQPPPADDQQMQLD